MTSFDNVNKALSKDKVGAKDLMRGKNSNEDHLFKAQLALPLIYCSVLDTCRVAAQVTGHW
jgi:hypothetical protein